MTAFSPDEFNDSELDFRILRDGGIALYWKMQHFDEDVTWLQSKGYKVIQFECVAWESLDKMHDSLSALLSFPSYYGRNVNALDDCMCVDLEVPEQGGLCLAFKHYDAFSGGPGAPTNSRRGEAEIVLDILARASRCHMLKGERLVILVQSDDPRVRFDELDGVNAVWNCHEWFDKDRGL